MTHDKQTTKDKDQKRRQRKLQAYISDHTNYYVSMAIYKELLYSGNKRMNLINSEKMTYREIILTINSSVKKLKEFVNSS